MTDTFYSWGNRRICSSYFRLTWRNTVAAPGGARGRCGHVGTLAPTRPAGSPGDKFLPSPLKVEQPPASLLALQERDVSDRHHEQVRHSESEKPL